MDLRGQFQREISQEPEQEAELEQGANSDTGLSRPGPLGKPLNQPLARSAPRFPEPVSSAEATLLRYPPLQEALPHKKTAAITGGFLSVSY